MLRIARFKPTPPDNPPLEASDRKKEKGRRTEEAANDERNGKNKRIQSEHLFVSLPDGIIRSGKQLSRNDGKADLMRELDHNQHSVYLMYYHLIMVVKYRRKVIDDDISESAEEIFEHIARGYGITLEEWNHDTDHVHVMFRGKPSSEISKFINAYKSASSRLLKKEYPEIREKLWKEAFWSQSYCLLTAGGAPIEVIREYIKSQGEKR